MKAYKDLKIILLLCFSFFLTICSTLSLNPDYFLVPRDSSFISWPITTTTVEFGQQTRKEKITLDEIIYGFFAPKTFNGSWISDDELLYRDAFGNLAIMNLSAPLHEEPKILVSNITFVSTTHCITCHLSRWVMNNETLCYLLIDDDSNSTSSRDISCRPIETTSSWYSTSRR